MTTSNPTSSNPGSPTDQTTDSPIPQPGCEVALGFRFAGVHCGIKRNRRDLALVVADAPCAVAGMFTSNRVQAPPVRYCREVLAARDTIRAVVINSGNANACTGTPGMRDAREMAQRVADALGLEASEVLVGSTGVIGRAMPMEKVRAGIDAAAANLSADATAGRDAAEAILTTDTRAKTANRAVELSTGTVSIGGMAKGSGMIAPDLIGLHATTLAYLTTDAQIPSAALRDLLHIAMDDSFNAITVDGDTSTNDTVLLLASGASGTALATDEDRRRFAEALKAVAFDLAMQVVRDGEGAQRVIEVQVRGAASIADARKVARTVAESPLVKTAFCAGEPNWGRFMMALGRAGVDLDEGAVAIDVGTLAVVREGLGTDHEAEELRAEMTRDSVVLAIDLGGDPEIVASVWTCDLTEDYVRINGLYLT